MMNSAYIKSFLYASMAAGMLCLTACDDVKPDDRYIEGEPIEPFCSRTLQARIASTAPRHMR